MATLFVTRHMTDDQWVAAEAEWHTPSNWRYGFYYAPRDPRVWVRKRRIEFGWTLNMARRASWFWVAALVGTLFSIPLLRRLFA